MNRRDFLKLSAAGAAATVLGPRVLPAAAAAPRPNIVFILCDDLGYGDVHCLNPQRCKVPTPNMDRLAGQGMTFTDAHSPSAVCTPTRYGTLTGRYSWRSKLQKGVLMGYSEPLIAPDRLTVAGLLKQSGYHTACIGKWHLGWDWAYKGQRKDDNVDYSQPIANGPTTRGFDSFFGIAASLDMHPYIWVENDKSVGECTVKKAFHRPGPAHKDFEAVDVLPTLGRKACQYIADRTQSAKAAGDGRGQPFFLYLALTSPHTPIVPSKEWQGKNEIGPYGDFVMQTDSVIGQVIDAVDKSGQADNTLIILTSDNGFAPYVGVQQIEAKGHYPSAAFRGYKADVWDGGHRVPFIARWNGKVQAGSTCDQLACLTDLMATAADLAGAKVPETAGEDSVSLAPALLGRADKPLREAVIHHSINGAFGVRQGRWKLDLCAGSGGWASPKDAQALAQGLPEVQLYDMTADVGERKNLQAEHPEIVQRLTALLEKYIADGRSTPGPRQKNDADIVIHKTPKGAAKKAAKKK